MASSQKQVWQDLELPESFYNDDRPSQIKIPKDLPQTINPSRTEYELQLDAALTMRSLLQWQLFPFEEWSRFKIHDYYWNLLAEDKRPFRVHYMHECPILANMTQKLLLEIMDRRFPCVRQIMKLFPGKIFPCGGFFSSPFTSTDIDLFFVDCTEEEACSIMAAFELLFVETHHDPRDDMRICKFIRNHGTTSFSKRNRSNLEDSSYQFIHRLYPTLQHVLGGFDLSCSMIAFVGTNVVANKMGAWAWVNRTIVVDISRRSLSFEYRVTKYHSRGFDLIFPGLNHNRVIYTDRVDEEMASIEFYEELKVLKQKYNMVLSKKVAVMDWSDIYYDPRKDWMSFYHDYDGYVQFRHDPLIFVPNQTLNLQGFRIKRRRWGYAKTDLDNSLRDGDFVKGCYYVTNKFKDRVEQSDYDRVGKQNTTINVNDAYDIEKHADKFYKQAGKDAFITFMRKYEQDLFLQGEIDFTEIRKEYKKVHLFGPTVDRCMEQLQDSLKIKWIKQDPGRQWSSTVNPAIIEAKLFYINNWNGAEAYNLHQLLLSFRKHKQFNLFMALVPDVIKLIAFYAVCS